MSRLKEASSRILKINSVLSGASNSVDFITNFGNDGIHAKDNWNNYEIGLYKCKFINSIKNITASLGNNTMVYNNGVSNKTITFPDGNYTFEDIDDFIQQTLKDNGDYSGGGTISPFKLAGNFVTLKAEFQFTTANFSVNLSTGNLYKLLGYVSTKTYTYTGSNSAIFSASDRADINNGVLGVNINVDIVDGMILQSGRTSNIVFTGDLTGGSGDFNIEQPNIEMLYFPINITGNRIYNIRVWLTDQNGNLIKLDPTEPVDYVFNIRRIL